MHKDHQTTDSLRSFLQRLRESYARNTGTDDADLVGPQLSLEIAIETLEDLAARDDQGLPHVVVLGPTQAGKSTVVNLLLQQPAAAVSPLAAFTRALHGFAAGTTPQQCDALRAALGPLPDGLLSLTTVDSGDGLARQGHVVWDTPDFDSHASKKYRNLVAQVIALADLVVFVVSKEKYSDLTVWQVADLLYPLHRPLLLCLNKVNEDRDSIRDALARRVGESRYDDDDVPIYDLPYVADGTFDRLLRDSHTRALRDAVRRALHPVPVATRAHGARQFLTEHWSRWVQPVIAEIESDRQWRRYLQAASEDAVNAYREQYLDSSQHYATFNRAIAQLLALLEIPVIAGPLIKARQLLTWPLRTLLSARQADRTSQVDVEQNTLCELFDHLSLSLRRSIGDGLGAGGHQALWWQSLAQTFDREQPDLRKRFFAAVEEYQRAFQPEIEEAARSLYRQLQDSPATLNSLRVARVTADAGGVALAFKTGAIGVNELVLTPAMLALTSLLAESAVGKYMETIKNQLKTRQLEHVRLLIDAHVTDALAQLPDRLDGAGLFGIGHDELLQAESERETLST